MKKTFFIICLLLFGSAITGTLVISRDSVMAADKERAQQQIPEQEQIYGSQLMTQQERAEYRTRMNTAKTVEERERIRNEHHERMKERAREQGLTLPAKPLERGMGRGMGPRGGGMGKGGRNR